LTFTHQGYIFNDSDGMGINGSEETLGRTFIGYRLRRYDEIMVRRRQTL